MPDPISPSETEGGAISDAEARFERWRKIAGVFLAPLAFFLTYRLTADLPPEGRRLSAILAGVAVMWVTEVLPLPVTALLGAALCVILGVAPAKQVLAYFGDPVVFVFIGGFMIARAMTVHALDRRIALSFLSLRFFSGHPARMLAGVGLVTGFLSMWISNTATTAMMLPIALGILSALRGVTSDGATADGATPINPRHWAYATGMMLMVPYAASLGGIGTPVGSPPNLIGIAQIREATGRSVSFFEWMAVTTPIMAAAGVALFGLLWWLHRDGRPAAAEQKRSADAGEVHAHVAAERSRLGAWTAGQRCTLIAFLFAVTLWILPGVAQAGAAIAGDEGAAGRRLAEAGKWFERRLPESIVAICAAVLLFVLPTDLRRGRFALSWPQAAQIDWGTILLFGGGIALGGLMFSTGVARAMGEGLTGMLGVQSLWALTAVSIAIGIVISESASNTASATMIIPVVIAISQGAGVSPIPPALGACLGASFGFMLPVSTPPNAIAYGSGLIPLPKMMRAGAIFDVVGFLVIWAGLRVMCPLVGLV